MAVWFIQSAFCVCAWVHFYKPWQPHLITAGGQIFSKGLDGADLVVLDQLGETAVRLRVSWYDKVSVLILGDNKMTAPVVTPWEKAERGMRKNTETVQQGPADMICLTCRTGCSQRLYRWDEWGNSPCFCPSGDPLLPCSGKQNQLNKPAVKLGNMKHLMKLFISLLHHSENRALLMLNPEVTFFTL